MELREWLNQFKSQNKSKLDDLAQKFTGDEIFGRIVTEISKKDFDLSGVYSQLSAFVKTKNEHLMRFCVALSPALLLAYANSVVLNDIDYEIEVVLLLIHNQALPLPSENLIPRLSNSSIYHDSLHLTDSLVELKVNFHCT